MESSQETNLPNRSSSPVVWAMAVSKKVFCMIVLMHLMSPPESAPTAASGNAVGNRSSPTVFACTNKGCKVDLVWCQDDKVFDNGDIPDCKSHHSWQSRSVCECDGRVMVVLDGTYSCEFEGPDGTIDGEYYTAPASCFPPEGRRQNQSDNSPKEMQGGESNSTDSAGAGNDQENPPNTGAIVGGVVGGLLGIVILTVAGIYLKRYLDKQKRNRGQREPQCENGEAVALNNLTPAGNPVGNGDRPDADDDPGSDHGNSPFHDRGADNPAA
ncbi:uncharacterized protein LOC115365396 isoform X1 [Myripristis murdjan]|uniref:uncharacterized protein LOC115365396 isoform X1 n=1 Tax=Myripristis murdjan TaxID=586833 RepID=UPI001175E10D|nr:uncharacterized protein LOC115365396 isoform X1 [Myripristis murdjan]